MAALKRGVLLLAAAAFVGLWIWRQQPTQPPDPGSEKAISASDSAAKHVAAPGAPRYAEVRLPGLPPPAPIESATPAEIAALRQAEALRSQARPAVATYKGIDGRQHAFRYEQTEREAADERVREEREAALMRELEADPAAFARRYGLRAREIELILDGSARFPPALLD